MKQINFSDGTTLCALGQGTWNMGRNPLNRKRETDALLLGIDLGMTMIDTAEMYANEEFVGNAIAAVRNVVFLVSKVLPEHASYVGTLQACEQSLKRLGTDRIDLYLLHWKGLYPFEETIKAMTKLQKEGKIVRWGVSNIDVDDMNLIQIHPHGGDCCVNQVLYNLGERGVDFDLIPWSQQNNIVVIAYSPIAMGKLLQTSALMQVANKHQASPAQIALAWTIRMKGVMAIPKASTESHVRENLNALNISLDQEDIRLLDMAFPPPHRKIPLAGW